MRVFGESNGQWRGRNITYRTAHNRVASKHGPAAARACAHCGDPAADWAYDHGDPDALRDARGRPYSPDPDRYIPLCRRCHKRFDGLPQDPCGTVAAYHRHRRRREPPCVACRAASAAYELTRRRTKKSERETRIVERRNQWSA